MAYGSSFEELLPEFESDRHVSLKQKWKSISAQTTASETTNGFDCNICLDTANEPVVTLCGHLYCWSCVYKWLHVQSSSPEVDKLPKCPVCKANISQASLVPLYGRGTSSSDSNAKAPLVDRVIPPRPPALGAHSMLTSANLMTLEQNPQPHPGPFQSQPQPFQDQQYFPHPYSQYASMASSSLGGTPMTSFFSPTVWMFGDMFLARMFGGSDPGLLAYHHPNSVLMGAGSPRLRRHEMQLDRSLNRVSIFLFCCFILCLLLF